MAPQTDSVFSPINSLVLSFPNKYIISAECLLKLECSIHPAKDRQVLSIPKSVVISNIENTENVDYKLIRFTNSISIFSKKIV